MGLVEFLSDLENLRLSRNLEFNGAYWCFDKDEQNSIRTTLEFWSGRGRLSLAELLKIIEDGRLGRVLKSIVEQGVRDVIEGD